MKLSELKEKLAEQGIDEDADLDFFQASSHYQGTGAVKIQTTKALTTVSIFVQERVELTNQHPHFS